MKKYIGALVMLALSCILVFSACGNNNDTAATQWQMPERLVMGTSAGFFPFEFIAQEGEAIIGRYAGVDISLVYRIGQELGVEIEILDMAFPGLIMALQAREVDFVAAAMTIRPDRAEMVNFSIPYFNTATSGQFIVVRDDSTVESMQDLVGGIVGVQIGTTGDFAVTDSTLVLQEIVRLDQPAHSVPGLLSGSLDAFVIDGSVARALATSHDGLRAFPDVDFFGPEQYGMAFHLEDLELLAAFNEVLERLVAEGYVDYLYAWYISEFAPPDAD